MTSSTNQTKKGMFVLLLAYNSLNATIVATASSILQCNGIRPTVTYMVLYDRTQQANDMQHRNSSDSLALLYYATFCPHVNRLGMCHDLKTRMGTHLSNSYTVQHCLHSQQNAPLVLLTHSTCIYPMHAVNVMLTAPAVPFSHSCYGNLMHQGMHHPALPAHRLFICCHHLLEVSR